MSRMSVILEAIAGVIYVAILIARLAGSYGQREARDVPRLLERSVIGPAYV